MAYFYSFLLALPLIVTGNIAVAQDLAESNNGRSYPEEFVREYNTECINTSMEEGLAAAEAEILCDCTINKFASRYELAEFKQLTIDSSKDQQAQAKLVEVGQVCFEQILYEQ